MALGMPSLGQVRRIEPQEETQEDRDRRARARRMEEMHQELERQFRSAATRRHIDKAKGRRMHSVGEDAAIAAAEAKRARKAEKRADDASRSTYGYHPVRARAVRDACDAVFAELTQEDRYALNVDAVRHCAESGGRLLSPGLIDPWKIAAAPIGSVTA